MHPLALLYSNCVSASNAMRSIPLRGFSVQAEPIGGARLNPQAVFDSFFEAPIKNRKKISSPIFYTDPIF